MPYLPSQHHSGVFQGEARPLTRRRSLLFDRRPARRYHRGRPARFADAGVGRDAGRIDRSRLCAGADCEAGRRTTACDARELRRSAAQVRSYGGLGRGVNPTDRCVWCAECPLPAGLSGVHCAASCRFLYVCITHENCALRQHHWSHKTQPVKFKYHELRSCDLWLWPVRSARPPARVSRTGSLTHTVPYVIARRRCARLM